MLVTCGGKKYVLVMREHFTKWVELVGFPNKTTDLSARAVLKGILARFWAPTEILTNQGTNFRGEFRSLLTEFGILG